MNERILKTHITTLLLFLVSVVPNKFVQAQEVSINVEPSALLEGAQVLSVSGLGISTDGSGPVIMSMTMENLTGEKINNLYLEIIVSAAKKGNIVEYTQDADVPFSLDPYQSIYVTNNHLANETFPGVEERISFSGGLTNAGDDLIGELSGSTTLPRDTYAIEVTLFSMTDSRGRTNLASDVVEIGGTDDLTSSVEVGEIYLKTPGDVLGSESEITNPYPQFNWEGETKASYRLLVVEQNEQGNPESLMQSAKSSSPVGEGGSLLEFENLDVVVEGNSFQYPSSGAQPLERGKTYYWRVLATIRSSGDVEEVSSEIWNFTLIDQTQPNTPETPVSEELEEAIIQLVGEESYRRLSERGFELESVEYDGQQFTGMAATMKLEELLQKIRDEEIILDRN